METGEVRIVQLADVRENPAALRSVDVESEDFEKIKDSIKEVGILNAVLGVDAVDPETGEKYVGLVDGLQRTTAAKMLGFTEIPMLIKTMDEQGILTAQIITNIQRIDTKPADFAKGLHRLLALNPTKTLTEFAREMAVSLAWLQGRLKLTNLIDEIQVLVNSGDIIVSNAVHLGKMPPEEQLNWLEAAQTESPGEFVPKIAARMKEIQKANREGRETKPLTFADVVKPVRRKLDEIVNELTNQSVGANLCNKLSLTTAEEGFELGLKWAMSMDPDTVEVKKAEWEEKQAVKAEKAEKKATERKARKEELAAAKATEETKA